MILKKKYQGVPPLMCWDIYFNSYMSVIKADDKALDKKIPEKSVTKTANASKLKDNQ
ncbi:MAG: hypothetical protein AB7S48_09140 [Bacteroidales bacterium]